jgi:alpha-D-ribose 1-methylphosphonate 5-triphosphate synthase subunit PhnL
MRRARHDTHTMILSVRNLAKRFEVHHVNRVIPAFSDVSFSLAPGAFTLIRGSNGAGKSTLIRCLFRTYLPTSGSAIYRSLRGEIDLASAHDMDIVHLRKDEIGYVSQFLRPRPRVSALELVTEPRRAAGFSPDEARRSAEALLSDLGLKKDLWTAYPATFSGGEQQKVNLARVLGVRHRLLLLDEPTASLDAAARGALVDQLAQLKRAGVAMIGVFHHPEDVAALIDDEVVLSAEHEPEKEV